MEADLSTTLSLIADQLSPDCFIGEAEEMDLIEIRVREAIIMETEMAAYLRELGAVGARVVIESLSENPCVSVYGLILSAEEAAELLHRLDPEGKSRPDPDKKKAEPKPKPKPKPTAPKSPPSPPSPVPQAPKEPPKRSVRNRRLGGFPKRNWQ